MFLLATTMPLLWQRGKWRRRKMEAGKIIIPVKPKTPEIFVSGRLFFLFLFIYSRAVVCGKHFVQL